MMRTLPNRHSVFIWLLAVLLVFPGNMVFAQQMMPVNPGSVVTFKVVNHLIGSSTVTGTFNDFRGSIVFDPNHVKDAAFDVTVGIATISTGIGLRDRHLKKEEYFNADKYPVARFRSTQVSLTDKTGLYLLHGQLTLKGITRPVDIPFTAQPEGKGWLFKGQFTLNRRNFGVGPDNSIGDDVTVMLTVKAI